MTYFKGMSEPREEARMAKFARDPKRVTFTQEDYDSAKEGDLYFMKRSSGAQRYYVPVEKGDHGVDEDGLLVVTHKQNGFGWERYDPHGNIVIPLYNGGEDAKFAAYRAIEQALYDTALGKAVGRDGMRGVAQSLSEKFGLDAFDEYENSDRRFKVKDEENEGIRTALIELLAWTPQAGYPPELGKLGAEYDDIGFAQDAEGWNDLLEGRSDGFGGEGDGKITPLMSQPVLYAVVGGKHDGRGIWGRLTRLMEIVGVEWKDVK